MARWQWAAALVVMVFASLLISAPARLLVLIVPADRVIIQGFSGTLWRGSAARCLVDLGPGYIHLGRVSWSLRPLSLLRLSPSLEISSDWGNQHAAGRVTWQGEQTLTFDDFSANLSAYLLRQVAPLSVTGNFSVQLEHLQISAGLPSEGRGRIVWRNAAWQSPLGVIPLGTYALVFEQPPGQALSGEVVTISGPVAAAGSVEVDGRSYVIDVMVDSAAGLDSQLQQALSLLAQPVADGYRIRLDGQF